MSAQRFTASMDRLNRGMTFGLGALTLGVAVLITTAKNPRKKAKIEATARKHLELGPGGVGVRF